VETGVKIMENSIQVQNSSGSLALQSGGTALAEARQLSPSDVIARIDAVKTIMANIMLPGIHYGKIEGCGERPCLSKAGAEMLAMTFRLCPEIAFEVKELGDSHREYIATCSLRNISTGVVWAQGLGSCSTLEKKYRYRYEWHNNIKTKVENKDLAEVYNTCLKMAKKRAQVDATLTALSCSHLFTQDLEDYKEDFEENKNAPPPPAKSPSSQKVQDAEVMPPKASPAPEAPKRDYNLNLNGAAPPKAPKLATGLTQAETAKLCEWLRTLPSKPKYMSIVKKYCDPMNIGTLSKAQTIQLIGELVNVFGPDYDTNLFADVEA
jgi:hypothetical protein